MQVLLAVCAALCGFLLIPLALAGGTAWLLLPAHLLFSVLCTVPAVLAGLDGRPWRARGLGGLYLLLSLAAVLALQVGSSVRDDSIYWVLPWTGALLWAWIPPLLAGLAAALGASRRRSRTRRTVRARRRARAALASASGEEATLEEG